MFEIDCISNDIAWGYKLLYDVFCRCNSKRNGHDLEIILKYLESLWFPTNNIFYYSS